MSYHTALIEGLVTLDTQSSDNHLTRAQRDALRIHAQQILGCLSAQQEPEQDIAVVNYFLNDLAETAAAMANDYAANDERAFQQKEYEKWKKIVLVCQQQREKLAAQQDELAALGHHAMGRGTATCLLGDMSNLSYVLAMNAAGILKTTSLLTTAFGAAATTISTVATTMNMVQPYLGMGLYSALVVFDTVCIAKHSYEREVEGKKKKEKSYTKLLEHGRWMHWVNAAAWITAGALSTLSFATPVMIVSVMACAILITSVVRIAHQSVELKKLKDVEKSYARQLADESMSPEKKAALQMLQQNVNRKIKMHTSKLTSTTVLATATMIGISLLITAIAVSFTPLMIVGAALLLFAGIATIITNRKAIGAAFKTIFKPKAPKQEVHADPHWVEEAAQQDDNLDNLSVVAQPDEELDELNRHFTELGDGDDKEKSVAKQAKEAGITYEDRVPENTRTKRALSSMARTYRPPTGDSKDVLAGIEKRKAEKQQEALRELEDDESESI